MKTLSSGRGFVVLGTAILLGCSTNDSGTTGPAAVATSGGMNTDGSAGAGGSGGGGGSSGSDAATDASMPVPIDPNRKLADLTRTERGDLCDWWQNMLGGYNMMFTCTGGSSVATAKDQEECAGSPWPSTCTATVAELELCVRTQAPSHGCNRPPECDRIIAC
jgi:hypothetical protein